jgi:hypothetical protein
MQADRPDNRKHGKRVAQIAKAEPLIERNPVQTLVHVCLLSSG